MLLQGDPQTKLTSFPYKEPHQREKAQAPIRRPTGSSLGQSPQDSFQGRFNAKSKSQNKNKPSQDRAPPPNESRAHAVRA